MTRTIRLGISTCPNDTFAFHGILTGAVNRRGLDFRVDLLDIEELNERLLRGTYDVSKASFHAALLAAEETVVLPSGSALGFGVGPLLLARAAGAVPSHAGELALCPGRHTTATLLFDLFHPRTARVEQVVFSDIMPRLRAGSADYGVCIHEGRFTWEAQGLALVEDLGTRWERETGAPLPLGGIVASRRLPAATLHDVQGVIRDSLSYALAHRDETLSTMRRHAQEQADDVLWKHVDLYVNQWTLDLGAEGRRALGELADRAAAVGTGAHGRLEVLAG